MFFLKRAWSEISQQALSQAKIVSLSLTNGIKGINQELISQTKTLANGLDNYFSQLDNQGKTIGRVLTYLPVEIEKNGFKAMLGFENRLKERTFSLAGQASRLVSDSLNSSQDLILGFLQSHPLICGQK